ncbi:tryptophan halogenase family protein [Cellvibrio sp. pealriver]|uniref:tryptophan halogenase family protein n=1 Tax=Cellvibrio sp. pealriver TaxID=1622269 RepID=UPI000AE7CF27|nr:tryptophan halogenase family protein [Cellvibrio sp. pealriver]
MNQHHQVKSIVIAGGGTAGWMAAAKCSQHFAKTDIKITVVESSEIGTVGVGEATIPTLRRFYQSLGMSDADVMRKTSATVKLGIEFKDWYKPDTSFIHPFGLFGHAANGIHFHHYWLKLKTLGDTSKLEEYSLGIALARANRFDFPSPKPSSPLSVFDWALHFDAGKFAMLMRDYSLKNNVQHIDAKIESVQLNPDNGFIQSLRLDNHMELHADLFIDCTGFNGLLIKGALNTGYEDWSQWLLCDRALAVQSELVGEPAAHTVSKAHSAGWQWKIPLQHRQGNGHVYSSRFMDDAEAEAILLRHIDGKVLHAPRKFKFTAGRRAQAWNKNCIAIGLAAGFLEPLESTSIALIETGIEKICGSFPVPSFSQKNIDYFNQVTATEWERIRDFIILHYKINQRTDSEFWQHCRTMSLPDTLQQKIDAYQERGELLHFPWEIFHPDSWLAIYSGFNICPKNYDKNVDRMNPEYLQQSLTAMRKSIADAVASVPTHREFINAFCKTDVV